MVLVLPVYISNQFPPKLLHPKKHSFSWASSSRSCRNVHAFLDIFVASSNIM